MSGLLIDFAHAGDAAAMDAIVAATPNSLIYYSSQYREFLRRVMPEAECHVLAARHGDRLVGFLPLFLYTAAPFGSILNSQPFFGSHGGALVAPDNPRPEEVKIGLYSALARYAQERELAALTVVESPFDPLTAEAERVLGTTVVDHRVGQFSSLPEGNNIEEEIMARLHVKTRNAVRKGQKLALDVHTSAATDDIAWLQSVHAESIDSLGGVAKPLSVFTAMFEIFGPSGQIRLYIGRNKEQRPVCGVLILLHRDTVEYFTPVVEPEYRDSQALSALLVDIMVRVANEGYRTWNWGGTWPTQEGVYRFKSRWGAVERNYRYHNRVFSQALAASDRALVLASYPHFYAFKFR